MSANFFSFATIVVNEYGYSPHFCNIVKSIPTVPTSVQSEKSSFLQLSWAISFSHYIICFFLAEQTLISLKIPIFLKYHDFKVFENKAIRHI